MAIVALHACVITAGLLHADSVRSLGDWVLYLLLAMWCGVALIGGQYYWLHLRGG